MNDHEAGSLVFIAEPQRKRVRTLFELGAKRRKDIVALLDHDIGLDRRWCRPFPEGKQFAGPVENQLRKLGAPATCFMIGGGDLDGLELPLPDALRELNDFDGAFISCIPGKLGYYQYEGRDGRYLCYRPERT